MSLRYHGRIYTSSGKLWFLLPGRSRVFTVVVSKDLGGIKQSADQENVALLAQHIPRRLCVFL